MENNIDYKFNEIAAKTIKKYRERKNMSLEDVVNKMHNSISRQSLFKYENNIARMKNSVFNEICYALGENPSDVWNEIHNTYLRNSNNFENERYLSNERNNNNLTTNELSNDESARLDYLLSAKAKQLNDDEKKAVLNVINAIIKEFDDNSK